MLARTSQTPRRGEIRPPFGLLTFPGLLLWSGGGRAGLLPVSLSGVKALLGWYWGWFQLEVFQACRSPDRLGWLPETVLQGALTDFSPLSQIGAFALDSQVLFS